MQIIPFPLGLLVIFAFVILGVVYLSLLQRYAEKLYKKDSSRAIKVLWWFIPLIAALWLYEKIKGWFNGWRSNKTRN